MFCCQKRKCKFALRPSHKEHLEPEEDAFLKSLYQFMQDRNTPISRLPTLGFKEREFIVCDHGAHQMNVAPKNVKYENNIFEICK